MLAASKHTLNILWHHTSSLWRPLLNPDSRAIYTCPFERSFFHYLSFLKNFWTGRGTKFGWALWPWPSGGGAVLTGTEERPDTHTGMRCTYSHCEWRGKGRPWSSCWTCPGRPFEVPYPCLCWCRFLPALAPWEASRGMGQVRDHRRGGRQQGGKVRAPGETSRHMLVLFCFGMFVCFLQNIWKYRPAQKNKNKTKNQCH